jgi:hypothetical protein
MSEVTEDARVSITRSFRFEREVLNVLDDEAVHMGISVNALVGIILKRYAEFTRYLSKIDLVVVNREMLTSILDEISEEKVYELGSKLGRSTLPDTLMFWKKELTERGIMEYIEKVMCRYGHLGTYDERLMPGGQMTIVVRHGLGKKGSSFLEGYLKTGFEVTVGIKAVVETTESSVKCELPFAPRS